VPGPIELIIHATADEFGITATALLSRNRSAKFSHPRILAMSLARELTKLSYPAIGRAFGKHHSTIISAVDRSPELLELHPEYVAKREAVLVRLGQSEPT